MGVAPSRRGGEAPENGPVQSPGRGQRLHGTADGPFPVAGDEESQAAAAGELVARAVAVVRGPVTFMSPTITRSRPMGHTNLPDLGRAGRRACPAQGSGPSVSP
ncbi:hypothetical protein SCMC78_28870 [Streptomyces sp. CMC78]|uniref:Uncharacterized protein n=1 Tax=Streptomyces sp. CMC78 TaxID=3231512 RepID=A0AB33KN61_9ACTN